MIYKYTSVQRVIAKVFADLDLKEGTHPISDMISWCGEALEKIGAFPQFVTKVTGKNDQPLIEIQDYQGRLPLDFHRLIQMAYAPGEDGPWYPMRSATGSMEFERENLQVTGTDPEDVASNNSLVLLTMSLYDLTYEEALNKINTEPATRSLLTGLLTSSNSAKYQDTTTTTSDFIYTINGSWIKTNMDTGYIMLSYQAIPTDVDGYPLIPDDQSFIDALYWYIAMKILYPQWVAGQVRDAVYYDAKRSWNYYSKQAYGNAMMPDTDQMESIKNTWLRMIPEIGEHDTFFSTLGQRQILYNQENP
jgi:hypothetical protein